MSTKGIIFSGSMVRALLAGRKTQTRRLLNPQPRKWEARVIDIREPVFDEEYQQWGQWETIWNRCSAMWDPEEDIFHPLRLAYAPGDRLYVREAYYQFGHWEPVAGVKTKGGRQKWAFVSDSSEIRFDTPPEFQKGYRNRYSGKPSWHARLARFMPKTASRLWLEVTEVCVQRLQDISEADAIAEGIEARGIGVLWGWIDYEETNPNMTRHYADPRESYRSLWDSLHTESGTRWQDNPWVVAVSFSVHHGNVDEVAA